MKLKVFIITICLCLFVVVGAAWATPFPVDLNYSSIAGDTGITYATVYGEVINETTFQFDIMLSAGYQMKNFWFNSDIAGLTAADNISFFDPPIPSGFTALVDYGKQGGCDGFGKFDILMDKTGQHDVTELKFKIIKLTGTWTADDFFKLSTNDTGHFAAAIWDTVNDPGGRNTFFARDGGTPKVPEPNTMILLGSGLLGLALYGRRKFRG